MILFLLVLGDVRSEFKVIGWKYATKREIRTKLSRFHRKYRKSSIKYTIVFALFALFMQIFANIDPSQLSSFYLISVLIVAHLATLAQPNLIHYFIFSSKQIREYREYFRLFTPFLAHAGWLHLIMNAVGIYYFAPIVDIHWGPGILTLIFVFSVLGGSIFSLILRRNDADYQSLGASGGVSGLLMASFFLEPHLSVGIIFIPVAIPAYIFGILFSIGSIILTRTQDRNRISHEGHLGGLFFGGLVAAAIMKFEMPISELNWLLYLGLLPAGLYVILHWAKIIRN
jgi:membrane associated rhomboid family serine protease